MVTVWSLARSRVMVNVAVVVVSALPSRVAAGLLIVKAVASSSRMVPMPGAPTVSPGATGVRLTRYVSLFSSMSSPLIVTVAGWVVTGATRLASAGNVAVAFLVM